MHANLQKTLDIKNDFALFENIKSVGAKQARKSLRSITRQISTPIESSRKDTYLVGPYKLGPAGKRANQNIEAVSALVFDIDDPKGYTFDDIIALTSDYFGVVHTTWSHTDGAPRYRLIIHLIEEIAACDFSKVRDSFLLFNPELASIVDSACKDISRAYYWFSYPPERSDNAQCCILMGNPINPQQLKAPAKTGQGLNLLGAYSSQLETILEGGIPEGSRNKSLASLVGGLIAKGLSRHESYSKVMEWNKTLNPPLPLGEVERTHNNIWKTHERNNPGALGTSTKALSAPLINFELLPASSLLSSLPPPREWIIQNFLPRKIVATIIAAGGTGKSYLAMHIAVSVASGAHLFGTYSPDKAGKVVFISGEDDADELQRRLHKVISGLPTSAQEKTMQNLHFIDLADSFELFTEKSAQGETHLTKVPSLICEQVIKQIGADIGLVVIDPISRFRGGEENSSADGTRFVQALQQIRDQLNTCVLTLHHVNKMASSGASQNNARGSSAFIDGVRLAYQLNAIPEADARKMFGPLYCDQQLLRLQSVKSNYGKAADPMLLARRDDGSLELFDVLPQDFEQKSLLSEIDSCSLSKTKFKETYGGAKGKFNLSEKALVKKLEDLAKAGLITIPERSPMKVTEVGKAMLEP